ncbi:hypothetical protein P152DRAFT_268144 [Eremomyces bilateralis CBS 781.70]|uniref:Uncharacterized protein n=1 Tax=Eremomyces bilateralis CBS 781.70 TaxID=1392243 RepID=A0A6G1G8W7_9PEZI|nr:uncharacterized protein P152DRAFT_268144 [Eremomyces bilateralis CBS 781.70]KAF1814340.1 hypothetical protein P152DRAFT_268144 [Eremomyces bilateralis CBS 781.70]
MGLVTGFKRTEEVTCIRVSHGHEGCPWRFECLFCMHVTAVVWLAQWFTGFLRLEPEERATQRLGRWRGDSYHSHLDQSE